MPREHHDPARASGRAHNAPAPEYYKNGVQNARPFKVDGAQVYNALIKLNT